MMLKKAIAKSGRKILKAIKNVSASRLAKKQQHLQQTQSQRAEQQQQLAKFTLETRLCDSVYNLDSQKQHHQAVDSVNVYYMLSEDGQSLIPYERCYLCCCHCDERDENQRNENLENEMLRPEDDFVSCSTPEQFEFFDQPMIVDEPCLLVNDIVHELATVQ